MTLILGVNRAVDFCIPELILCQLPTKKLDLIAGLRLVVPLFLHALSIRAWLLEIILRLLITRHPELTYI